MAENQDLEIAPLTIKRRIVYNSLRGIAQQWYEAYAKENGYTEEAIASAVLSYLNISARVSGLNGLADFELSVPTDSPEDQRRKFDGFANSARVALVEMLERRIREMDAPDNALYAPDVSAEGEV